MFYQLNVFVEGSVLCDLFSPLHCGLHSSSRCFSSMLRLIYDYLVLMYWCGEGFSAALHPHSTQERVNELCLALPDLDGLDYFCIAHVSFFILSTKDLFCVDVMVRSRNTGG